MNSKLGNSLKNYLEISKLKIMIPVALTGFTGYFLFDQVISANTILITIGILLLAISASVLNQVQEADFDNKMNRTRFRPIPSGRISIRNGMLFFLLNVMGGSAILYFYGNENALITGIITILWYNGVYTYTKRYSAFAVVPGALTGALPPLIGWIAAGGSPLDKTIILFGFLLFTGQLPHFWLIILRYGEEYKLAGFPVLTSYLNQQQIGRLIFSWIFATAMAATFFYVFGIIQSPVIIALLLTASFGLVWQFRGLLDMVDQKRNFLRYPLILNLYFLFVLLLLISEKII